MADFTWDDDTELERDSDEWWVTKLRAKLRDRNDSVEWLDGRSQSGKLTVTPGLDVLWDYRRGEPPLASCLENWDNLHYYLRIARMNLADMVCSSVSERITPLGFTPRGMYDPNGDEVAARAMRHYNLDEQFSDFTDTLLWSGHGYFMVGPRGGDETNGLPPITSEDPRQVITFEDPVTLQTTRALKEFVDEWTGEQTLYFYKDGMVRQAKFDRDERRYEWLDSGKSIVGHKGCPVIHIRNHMGRGDYELHLDPIDRVYDGLMLRIAVAKYGAYRQRAFEDLPEMDEEGALIEYSQDAFLSSPGTAWRLPKGTKIWESQPVDLSPIRLAIKDDVEAVLALTRTPVYYASPDSAQSSAEGAIAQKEAHLFRVKDRMRRVARGLERAMELAYQVAGTPQKEGIRTLFDPTEIFSLAQKSVAVAAYKNGGLPMATILEDVLQKTPDEVAEIEALMDEERLFGQVTSEFQATDQYGQGAATPPFTPTPDTKPPSSQLEGVG